MPSITKKTFSFRFSNITAKQAEDLRKKTNYVRISLPQERISSRRNGGVVGIVSLRKNIEYKWISAYMKKHRISKSKCDVFVSIRTEYDTRIFALPNYAMKVIHNTGVDITFSFTSIAS